jgi:hypothetical protein
VHELLQDRVLQIAIASQGENDMARKRVADVLVDVLAEAGVPRVYGLAGDSLNGITDSIRGRKDIQWIHVRHEETAAFAAGAEAHLTAVVFRSWPLPRKYPAGSSRAGTFRRPTLSIFSRSAATIASCCHSPTRCPASSRSQCKQRCPAAVSP